MAHTPEDTMTVADVAELLKVDKATLRRWLKRGTPAIPHYKLGGTIRFWRSEIEAWLAQSPGIRLSSNGRKQRTDTLC